MKIKNPKKPQLDPTVKTKWLENLRSGKYGQAVANLQSTEADDGTLRFCCLGVLDYCVYRIQWHAEHEVLVGSILRDDNVYGLTEEFQRLLAISNDGVNDPTYYKELLESFGIESGPELDLVRDSEINLKAASFNSIADWIEKNL
jgi:hypothetical protein